MEVVASLLGALVTEPARILCGSIYSNVSNAFKFQSNFNDLKHNMDFLFKRRNEINEELHTANKEGKLQTVQVRKWLTEVEGIEKEVAEIEQEVDEMQANTNTVLCGYSLNYSGRCRLGTTVAEKLGEVNRLMDDSNFPAGMVEAIPRVKPVLHIPGPSIQSQTTGSANLDKIMNLLNDDAVLRIGIWGMGGVGKTTLVKNLNNNLQSGSSEQLFDIVIWVTVSEDFNLERVQTQIAERLGLTPKSKESVVRAIELHERLQEGKNFLLILDDVWNTFDLDSLGVPQPENHRGSKIILTSRSLEVCKGMRTDEEVKVEVLNSEEAWQLFVTNTGKEATSELIEPIAKDVAKECSGLPLALIIVGRAMAGKTRKEQWSFALTELQRSVPDNIRDIQKEVYNPLKLSYDFLQDNVRPCFLYCSLFPEDRSIEVNELVRCWEAEGLMDEQQNVEDSRNRGIAIIQTLKDSCLLEEGDDEDTVKLHDVVRDVAIWIASNKEDDCKFVVESGKGLDQISDVESLKPSKRVSFMNNSITTLPDCVIRCPKTSTLLLQFNKGLKRVPKRFLQGFQVLRVLNMSHTSIKSLPLSLAELGELRALILEECWKLEELPPLGGLRKLQLLDLSCTGIKELPKGTEKLSNLSRLFLRYTHYLKRIEAGVFSKLSGLEVLDMKGSSYKWNMIGDEEEGQATLEELGCLTRLISVDVDLRSLPYQDLHWIQGLRSFHIRVGGGWVNTSPATSIYCDNLDERQVDLGTLDLSEKRIGWLPINATHLTFHCCEEIGRICEYIVTNTQGLAGLKTLTICYSSLGSFRGCAAPHDMLPNLEELYIVGWKRVVGVRPLVALLGLKFSRLRRIVAHGSHDLKYLIPVELIQNLINLEEIRIVKCGNLEKLFDYDNHTSSGQMVAADPLLPKLRKLELISLPELKSICRENESWQSLEELVVIGCNQLKRIDPLLPKLRKLELISLPELRSICRGNESWQSLEELRVEECNQLKRIDPLLPKLRKLELISLPELKSIWRENESWQSLEELVVIGCNQLKRIDPLLPKLRKLELYELPELKSICRENESWQSLEELLVKGCNQLKRIPLTTQNENTIKRIIGEKEWWDDLEWEDDDTKLTLQPYFDPKPLAIRYMMRQQLITLNQHLIKLRSIEVVHSIFQLRSIEEMRRSNDPNSGGFHRH